MLSRLLLSLALIAAPTKPSTTPGVPLPQRTPAWLVNSTGTNKIPKPPANLRYFIDFPLTASVTSTVWSIPSRDALNVFTYCEIRPGNAVAFHLSPVPSLLKISADGHSVTVTHTKIAAANPMPIMRMGCAVEELP